MRFRRVQHKSRLAKLGPSVGRCSAKEPRLGFAFSDSEQENVFSSPHDESWARTVKKIKQLETNKRDSLRGGHTRSLQSSPSVIKHQKVVRITISEPHTWGASSKTAGCQVAPPDTIALHHTNRSAPRRREHLFAEPRSMEKNQMQKEKNSGGDRCVPVELMMGPVESACGIPGTTPEMTPRTTIKMIPRTTPRTTSE